MSNEMTMPSDQLSESSNTSQSIVSLAPVSITERISAMDVLRGFALIGILLMNIEWFNRPVSALMMFDKTQTGADFASSWFVLAFVQGKFYKLFSLLFGMGFAVMLIRAQEKGQAFGWWFSRRMFALFAFGMLHMVYFWGGDILHDYAFGGLLMLLLVLLMSTKRLSRFNTPTFYLKFGLTITMLPLVLMLGVGSYFGMTRDYDLQKEEWQERVAVTAAYEKLKENYVPENNRVWPLPEESTTEDKEKVDLDSMSSEEKIAHLAQERYEQFERRDAKIQKETYVVTEGTFSDVTEFRTAVALDSLKDTLFFAPVILLPIFCIGYWFVASGVMRRPQEHKGLFKAMAWIGLLGGLMINVATTFFLIHPASEGAAEIRTAAGNMKHYGEYILMIGYVGAFVLMCLSQKMKKVVGWLAPMGRMALTNYLMHSAILTFVFYNYGLGMFGEVSRSEQMLFVIAIIVSQAIFSTIWLKFFKFGPMEWLWRSLTYMKFQSIR